MRVKLPTKQVLNLFGPRPWLGRRLPNTFIHTTCGIEWYRRRVETEELGWIPVGEGYFRPHKVTVNAVIALKPVEGKRNVWDVVIDPKFESVGLMWLANNFEGLEVIG